MGRAPSLWGPARASRRRLSCPGVGCPCLFPAPPSVSLSCLVSPAPRPSFVRSRCPASSRSSLLRSRCLGVVVSLAWGFLRSGSASPCWCCRVGGACFSALGRLFFSFLVGDSQTEGAFVNLSLNVSKTYAIAPKNNSESFQHNLRKQCGSRAEAGAALEARCCPTVHFWFPPLPFPERGQHSQIE